MLFNQLKQKLSNEIPLTNYMQLEVKSYDEKHLITYAPLKPNVNDKGTAFAGSLCTMTTISSWSLCWLISQEMGFKNTSIVILKNDIQYLKPITNDFTCHTNKPSLDELEVLKEKLNSKKSGSIKITSNIHENGETCVTFEGIYVIKIL